MGDVAPGELGLLVAGLVLPAGAVLPAGGARGQGAEGTDRDRLVFSPLVPFYPQARAR
jgi:hypothetical protein